MNPKFKIGDKVTIKNESPRKQIIFEIAEIIISKSYVLYAHIDDRYMLAKKYYDERDLELYTEPKPKVKKYLYAYSNNGDTYITGTYYKSDEDFAKTRMYSFAQRLDWSMIEVEE